MSATAARGELDGQDRFDTLGSHRREPCHFDELVGDQSEESSVMRMTLSLETGLEEVGHVDFGLHQHRARSREPSIELLRRPRSEESGRRCLHVGVAAPYSGALLQVRRGAGAGRDLALRRRRAIPQARVICPWRTSSQLAFSRKSL